MVEGNQASGKMLEHYKLLKQLGDGQFGVAYLAQDTSNAHTVCCKVFKDLDKATQKTFEAEVQAGTSGLIHPNVIKLVAAGRSAIKVDGESMGDVFYIVMELAANGEAFDYVEAAGGLEDKYARQIFTQLIDGVSYIHKKNIAHRDMKLENCFLDKDCVLKVADFGLQKAFAGPKGVDLKTRCGTPNYMAPELLGGKDPYDGPAVDIFACGAILFILKYAKFAFATSNDSYYRRLHRDPARAMADRKIPYDQSFMNLVTSLLKPDPKSRISLADVRKHPWMQGETATVNEVRNHYYSLVPGRKCIDKAHYTSMQKARKEWAAVKRIERGADIDLGYDQKDLIQWVQDSKLFERKYKPFIGYQTQNGFYSKTTGSHLFLALYEHFAKQGKDASDIINVSQDENQFKSIFTLQETMEELPPDSDSEDEGEHEAPILTCEVSAQVQVVEANPDQETIPKVVYMSFKRKIGDLTVFGNFMNEIMKEMEKFAEPGYGEQE